MFNSGDLISLKNNLYKNKGFEFWSSLPCIADELFYERIPVDSTIFLIEEFWCNCYPPVCLYKILFENKILYITKDNLLRYIKNDMHI